MSSKVFSSLSGPSGVATKPFGVHGSPVCDSFGIIVYGFLVVHGMDRRFSLSCLLLVKLRMRMLYFVFLLKSGRGELFSC